MYISPAVNLVKDRRANVVDKILNWALTIGRAVIIIVEIVALSAFIYRFTLDRQIIDLHDKIKQEQNIVSYFKKSEDTYRNLQARLQLANNVITSNAKLVKLFRDVTSLVPSDMTIQTMTFSPENMRIDGTIQSINSLSAFVNNLKNYPDITNVSLDRIDSKPSTATIAVSISVTFKKQTTLQ